MVISTERPILSSKRCPFAANEAIKCNMWESFVRVPSMFCALLSSYADLPINISLSLWEQSRTSQSRRRTQSSIRCRALLIHYLHGPGPGSFATQEWMGKSRARNIHRMEIGNDECGRGGKTSCETLVSPSHTLIVLACHFTLNG